MSHCPSAGHGIWALLAFSPDITWASPGPCCRWRQLLVVRRDDFQADAASTEL